MDVSRPHGAISHPLDSAVLRVLVGTTQALTGRQVARLASEGSQQGIGKALNRLVGEGVVHREEAGSSSLYTLNRDHLATPAIELLVDLRGELLDRLRQAFRGWRIKPVHASMFGSAARGDGDASSDIDLFIVRPSSIDAEDDTWQSQIDGLADSVWRWTGNHAGIVELPGDDLGKLRRRRPSVLRELDADAIALAGVDIAKILKGES
jgi:DNA-binding transcriptional ArsR family regulator